MTTRFYETAAQQVFAACRQARAAGANGRAGAGGSGGGGGATTAWRERLAFAREAKSRFSVRPKTDEEAAYGVDVHGKHPGAVALRMAHEVLSQYQLPAYDVRFEGIRRMAGEGAYDTSSGYVLVGVTLRPPSDIREEILLPFRVHEARMLQPSVLLYDGQRRVITQNTFDSILKRGEFTRRLEDRPHVFSRPRLFGPSGPHRMPEVPVVRPGLFGRQEIRR